MGKQWDKIFKKYGKVFTKHQKDIPRIARLFKKKNIKRILDLGCGSGRHVVYLAKQGFNVYGIDIAPSGIKIAKNWIKLEKLKASLKVGSFYKKLPYKDNFFDAVISTKAIHHGRVKAIQKTIKEIERILKPGGLIFITISKCLRVKGWKKNKIVIYKERVGDKIKKTRCKITGYRIYTPIEGKEKGLIHFSFNKELIRKEFKNFKNLNIWIKQEHYCFLGELN